VAPNENAPNPVATAVRAKLRAQAVASTAVPPLTLPVQVITKADVSRLAREMNSLNEFFMESATKGASAKTVPQLTQQMTTFLNENKLNVLVEADRTYAGVFLDHLRASAPVVHASFASDPKADFLMRLIMWFRAEAHPHVVLQIGLQPSIAAGCIFRTTNKYFDFSFKKHFEDSKAKLGASLRAQA
jgi:hypothetical protein